MTEAAEHLINQMRALRKIGLTIDQMVVANNLSLQMGRMVKNILGSDPDSFNLFRGACFIALDNINATDRQIPEISKADMELVLKQFTKEIKE